MIFFAADPGPRYQNYPIMKSAVLKNLPTEKIDIAESMLRALGHPLRMRIIAFIDQNKGINVNKIYKSLKIEQSVASQQLRILREDDVVIADKKGKFVYYTLNYPAIQSVVEAVNKFLGGWTMPLS